MHWARWGDPGRGRRPARGAPAALVELAFVGTTDDPRVARRGPAAGPGARRGAARPGCAAIVGDEHVHTDHETRRAPHPRQVDAPTCCGCAPGDGADAPDAVVRPGRPRRGRGPGRLVRGAPRRAGPVRRRHVGRRRAGRAARRASPAWSRSTCAASTGCLASTPSSMTAILEAGAARPAGRGAARRARPDAGALPAVLRVRLDRRLRGDPLRGPVVGRATAASTRSWSAYASPPRSGDAGAGQRARPTPPAPTCARWCWAPRARSA